MNPENIEKRKGLGRPKGAQNKVSGQLKEMILHALDKAGGSEYLQKQADTNPAAFMTLVGKVLPLQVNNSGDVGVTVTVTTGVPRPDGK